MDADLRGILVVSIEQAVAAPYASCRLADAGARVIKIERPEGDFAREYDRLVLGQSAYFVWVNRGKESVCLDLKSSSDRILLERMIARADVLIQNIRPGSLAKMGLGSSVLRQRHPRLITCDITGFGSTGPRAHLKAYDLIVQAEVGLCAITGTEASPARVGVSVCDIAAGLNAHAAILQALYVRQRTGKGRAIRVSLFDSVAEWMNVPLLQLLYGERDVGRAGLKHPSIAPYGAYTCSDGASIICSVQNEREWAAFCELFLRRPEIASDARFVDNSARVAHRGVLDAMIAEVFSRLSESEASARLEQGGVAYGRVNALRDAATHPHLRVIQIETPQGDVRLIAPPAMVSDSAPSYGAVPERGSHTAAVRAEFSQPDP